VYRGTNNHIYALYLEGGSWKCAKLSESTGAPAASGDPAGYVRSDGTNMVVYRGTNNHIYALYLPKGGSWNYADLTQAPTGATGAPAASGDPAGCARSDRTNSVVYRGTNNHIYALYLEGDLWHYADLTDLTGGEDTTGAPAASGDPAGYAHSDGTNSVVYRGEDKHIYELYKSGDSWRYYDLTILSAAPVGASGNPVGYVRSDGKSSVVYRGEDKHIYELILR